MRRQTHFFVSSIRLLFLTLCSITCSTTFTGSTTFATAAMSSQIGRLAGKRVLVTGAGRGIGRAIAEICNKEGAKVAISSRTKSELEETASRFACIEGNSSSSSSVSMHVADVTNQNQVESMVKSIVDKWGGIDILINNAGGSQPTKGTAETLDSEDLRHLLDLNVISVHIVTAAVLRYSMLLEKSSSDGDNRQIVNISSRAGKVGLPNMSFYVASKFALEGMTASLAEELKDKNVFVNTLSPGMVNTKSFPKPEGRKGVRSAESIKDGLFVVLESGMTGHYLHVDELDQARERGQQDSAAMKPIREPLF